MTQLLQFIGRIIGILFKWIGILIILWGVYWAVSHYWTQSNLFTAQGTIVDIDKQYIRSSKTEFGNYSRVIGENDRLVIEFTDNHHQPQKFTTSQCLADDTRQVGNTITVYYDDEHQEVNCLRAWYAPLFLLGLGAVFMAIGLLLLRWLKGKKRI